jgi:hypothetical protein
MLSRRLGTNDLGIESKCQHGGSFQSFFRKGTLFHRAEQGWLSCLSPSSAAPACPSSHPQADAVLVCPIASASAHRDGNISSGKTQFCDPHHSGVAIFILGWAHEIHGTETSMSSTFTNPSSASWSAIARRIVERGHITPSQNEAMSLGERDYADVPFTRAEASAEVLKWFWQH